MYLIRRFEEGAEDSYMRGMIHGTMHLCIGQEASAVATCMELTDADKITSTHRGHGHCIAKGAEVRRMFAEFFGREDGYCHGRGGSMHIADVTKGNLGANGIVGGGLPIAVGAALAAKRLGRDDVTVCFFGDGANNEGAFHEALNMAAIWKLPVIFVCENNQYGMSTSTERSTAVKRISERAGSYAMPGVTVDGNDFSAVAEAMNAAIARARAGEGPSLVESLTYRWRGHSKSDRNRYRTKDEIESWIARDPIERFRTELVAHGVVTEETADMLLQEAEAEVAEGIEFAKASPAPRPSEVTRYVYAERAMTAQDDLATREMSYAEAIRDAMGIALDRDKRVILMGEDIGVYGGAFQVTGDLDRPLRARPGDGHADLRARRRRRRRRRGADRPAADLRVPVLRLRDARDGADRQPGGQAALHARRRGLGAAGDAHARPAPAPAPPPSTARASRPGSATSPA